MILRDKKECAPKDSRSIPWVLISGLIELHAKLHADTLLSFAIYHRQNETWSRKTTHIKQCNVTWQTDTIGLQKCDFGLPSLLLSSRQLQQQSWNFPIAPCVHSFLPSLHNYHHSVLPLQSLHSAVKVCCGSLIVLSWNAFSWILIVISVFHISSKNKTLLM